MINKKPKLLPTGILIPIRLTKSNAKLAGFAPSGQMHFCSIEHLNSLGRLKFNVTDHVMLKVQKVNMLPFMLTNNTMKY